MSFAARSLASVGPASSNSGTLTAGFIGDDTGYGFYTGYGTGFGSSSAGFFTDGKEFVAAYDYSIPAVGYDSANVVVKGFGSDPGKTGYMTSFTVNGVTRTAASATTYTYVSGTATWIWGSSMAPDSWGLVYGSTYSWTKT